MSFLTRILGMDSDFTFILWERMTLGQFRYRNQKNLDFGSLAFYELKTIEPHYEKGANSPDKYIITTNPRLTGKNLEKAENVTTTSSSEYYQKRDIKEQLNELRIDEYRDYFVAQVKIYLYGAKSEGGFFEDPSEPKIAIWLVKPSYEKTFNHFFVKRVMMFTKKGEGFTYKTIGGTSSLSPVYECEANTEYHPGGDPLTRDKPGSPSASSSSAPKQKRFQYQYDILDDSKGHFEVDYGELDKHYRLVRGVKYRSGGSEIYVGEFDVKRYALINGYRLSGNWITDKYVKGDSVPINSISDLQNNPYLKAFVSDFADRIYYKDYYIFLDDKKVWFSGKKDLPNSYGAYKHECRSSSPGVYQYGIFYDDESYILKHGVNFDSRYDFLFVCDFYANSGIKNGYIISHGLVKSQYKDGREYPPTSLDALREDEIFKDFIKDFSDKLQAKDWYFINSENRKEFFSEEKPKPVQKEPDDDISSLSADEAYRKGYEYHRAKDYKNAIKYMRQASHLGSKASYYCMGFYYEYGKEVERNLSTAMNYYSAAGDAFYGLAAFAYANLTENYFHDDETALRRYKECYENFDYISSVHTQAKERYAALLKVKEALDENNPLSGDECFEKAQEYRQNKDYHLSYAYYLAAAKKGNRSANFYLGRAYHRGLYVATDYEKAIEYYKKANSRSGYFNIGIVYANQLNDNAKALPYFQKAMEMGHPRAKEYYDKIKEDLGE